LRLALSGREFRELAVGVEDGVDETDPLEAARVLADGGFPVLAARVRKASDLDRRRAALAGLVVGAVGGVSLKSAS
jgi:hypothetical protein